MKEHKKAHLINRLTDVAMRFYNHQSLRQRLSAVVSEVFQDETPSSSHTGSGFMSIPIGGAVSLYHYREKPVTTIDRFIVFNGHRIKATFDFSELPEEYHEDAIELLGSLSRGVITSDVWDTPDKVGR